MSATSRLAPPRARGRQWLRMVGTDIRLAWRNVLRHRRRSAIAGAAIVFGIVAIMLSAGFVEWIYWANRELSTVNQIGHIQIVRPGFHSEGQADPYRFILPADTPDPQLIRALPGVVQMSPRLLFNGLVSRGETTVGFLGEGIDPATDPSSENLIVVAGKLLTVADTKGVLLGAGLAQALGAQVGDTVVLLATPPGGGIQAVEAQVRGLISVSLKAFDDNLLRVHIDLARRLLRTDGAQVWVVRLSHTDATPAVTERLRALPELQGLEVKPWIELADAYNKLVALFTRQVNVVKLIIALIIVLGIGNTMTLGVLERTAEIGTAMALGARRRRILALFLWEGLLLGLLAGLVGVGLGWSLARIISAVGIPMPPAPGMSRGYVAGILVDAPILVQALALALGSALVASVYPAWRAARLAIVDALRHNR